MVRGADSWASDLGSIPVQVCNFLKINFILLNSSNQTRIMNKLDCNVDISVNLVFQFGNIFCYVGVQILDA